MFELRGKKIRYKQGNLYPNSAWEAKPIVYRSGTVEAVVVIRGLIYATRTRGSSKQEPYAYINDDPNSGLGLWLNETEYEVLQPANDEDLPLSA